MDQIEQIFRILYYIIAAFGVSIAVYHYVRFIKDRSMKNLLDLSAFLWDAREYYMIKDADGNTRPESVSRLGNAVKLYCHLHNSSMIGSSQKSLHEEWMARNITQLIKIHPKQFRTKNKSVRVFITNNKSLFVDADALISKLSSLRK